jgi:hypothetical protein
LDSQKMVGLIEKEMVAPEEPAFAEPFGGLQLG